MTNPDGRYRVEWLVRGGWLLTDAFETYEAADTWAHTLLDAEDGVTRRGVRVIDTVREEANHDAVVWAILA